MKIFYGVQGTGNGHITRARLMAKELSESGIDVQFKFSGRPLDKFFDMEIFNDFKYCHGLTFNTDNGQVSYLKTVLQSRPIRFIQDVKGLDLSSYDLVISDFEPVTAWAAKTQKKNLVGIGHQYAFGHSIPRKGADPLAELVMKFFAPTSMGIGLHWHHFGEPILPPIIETHSPPSKVQSNKIVVYLPFENQQDVIQYLYPFTDYQFHLYSPVPIESQFDNIIYHPLSREGFQQDLRSCSGIISNAGFELASEALQLGKKILVKPLHAQMEQISNAEALRQLGYGHTMDEMDLEKIESWLQNKEAVRITYPNVARILVDWISQGTPEIDLSFSESIWEKVEVLRTTVE